MMLEVKYLPTNKGDSSSVSGLGRFPGVGNGKPTPVFLPGKLHGRRAWLATLHGVAKSHMTEHTHTHTHTHTQGTKILTCLTAKKLKRKTEAIRTLKCMCVLSLFGHVQPFVTLWMVACSTPLSTGFSRQEYWSGFPCPPPGDLPNPGIKPTSLYVFCIGSWDLD